MSTISSPLPPFTPALSLDRQAKSAHGRPAATPAAPDESASPVADTDTSLDDALARVQGQNQVSALTSIHDLDEALAVTRLVRQGLQSQAAAARSVHAGVTPATALRVLED